MQEKSDKDLKDFETSLRSFFALIRKQSIKNRQAEDGLSLPQYELLSSLNKPLSIRQLSEKMDLSSPTVTRMIDSLQKHDLVERKENKEDRRLQEISLTAAGKKAMRKKEKRVQEKVLLLYNSMDKKERQELISSLQRMQKVIEKF